MSLDDKIEAAHDLIGRVLHSYHSPVVMSSFGKDSMVLLDLVDALDKKLPIVFHREPFEPFKYQFANQIIQNNNYAVYDYPPIGTMMVKRGDEAEIVNRYQVGPVAVTWLGTGIKKPQPDHPFHCGYKDFYEKPVGLFKFPWDVALVGHKSTDVDPILGPLPLKVDILASEGACDFAYPLRHFTDADVWEYSERFEVPINLKRYDKANGYREFADITYNNDYYFTCVKCMDRDEPEAVFCPKMNCEISNISKDIRYAEPKPLSYIGKE